MNPIPTTTSGIPPNAIQQAASMSYDMAMAAEANKYSQFNAILLSFFAVAIPGVFGSAATYLIGRGTMEAGVKSMVEGLYFMQKLGGVVSGIAGGIGKFGGSIGKFGGGGGRSLVPEAPYDARPVEETPPAALPGRRGAPADRMLEKPEPATYTGRAPRGAKQLTGSSASQEQSHGYGREEIKPEQTGFLLFKDGTKIKIDMDSANNILGIQMKKPGSDEAVNLTPEEFGNYYKTNIAQQEGSVLLNRNTGKVIETEGDKERSYTMKDEELKEIIKNIDEGKW